MRERGWSGFRQFTFDQDIKVHVTGMLVQADGDFLQVIEGEPKRVVGISDRISVDPRHRDISVLQRGPRIWRPALSALDNGLQAGTGSDAS
jgi:hypothetical protein